MNDPKQMIVIRKDLNMRKGKMVAQGAHASMKAILNLTHEEYFTFEKELRLTIKNNSPLDFWIKGIFKKIVVGTELLSEVVNVYEEAKKQNIPCSLIRDSGLTEFGGKETITCCAIGPDNPDKIDKITNNLKLL